MLRDVTAGHRTIRKWLTARRLRRRFRTTPQYALDALPEDTFGRVTGVARPFSGEQLTAPLSLRPCVFWVIEIVEDVGEDWPSSLILVQEDAIPFVLDHEGHRAVVDPKAATVSLAFDHASEAQGLAHADRAQRDLLVRYLPHRDFTHTHVLHMREAVIEIGEAVTVLGSGTREPDPEAAPSAAYRDTGHTRLRLTGSKKYPICITDNPKIL
jgi:hypothetical protein